MIIKPAVTRALNQGMPQGTSLNHRMECNTSIMFKATTFLLNCNFPKVSPKLISVFPFHGPMYHQGHFQAPKAARCTLGTTGVSSMKYVSAIAITAQQLQYAHVF